MSYSRARYLVVTSRWLFGAVPVMAAMVYAIVSRQSLWRGDWWWGYNNLSQAMPIAVLVVAFVVGWDSGATGSGVQALLARTPDAGWKVLISIVAVPLGAFVGVLLLGTATVAGLTWSAHGVIDNRALLLVGSHILMLSFAAAIGVACGTYLSAPYAAVAAAGVIGVLLYWSPSGGLHLLGFVGASSAIVGGTPTLRYHLVDLIVLAAAALALLVPVLARRNTRVSAAIAAGIATVVVFAGSILGPTQQFEVSGDLASRCQKSPVKVCLYPGYDRLLPIAQTRLAAFLQAASQQGVPRSAFPSSFVQYGGVAPPVGVGVMEIGILGLGEKEIDSDALAGSVSTPLWCPQMRAQPPVHLLRLRQVVYDWALWLDGALPRGEFISRHRELSHLDSQGIASKVSADLVLMRSCSGG